MGMKMCVIYGTMPVTRNGEVNTLLSENINAQFKEDREECFKEMVCFLAPNIYMK